MQEPTGKDDVNTQVLKNENHKGSNETKSVWPLLDGDTMIDAGGGGGGGSCLFRTRENFFPLKATCVDFVFLATLLSVVVRLQTSNGWLMLLLLVLFKIFR